MNMKLADGHLFHFLLCSVALCFTPVQGQQARSTYPPDSLFAAWEQEIRNGSISAVYDASDKLYKLPHEPWPELWRKLLLELVQRHLAIRASIRGTPDVDFGDPEFKRRWIGEYAGNLVQICFRYGTLSVLGNTTVFFVVQYRDKPIDLSVGG